MKTEPAPTGSHFVRLRVRPGPPTSWRVPPIAALVALLSLPVAAQNPATGTVTGRVLSVATGEYLRNAVVSIGSSDLHAVSTTGGTYRITGVPPGNVTLVVSYLGLETVTVPVEVVAGQTVVRNVDVTSRVYDDDIVNLRRFVVSGEREANAKAMMEQRNAGNMKKILASDAFGKVPESNVGEFLKLMPGVTTDYVEADVRAIRLRGYHPKYTSVTIDGARVAMAGSSTIGTGRTFEFEQLSISSVESVEISKTPTPDQPSTVAGAVNLRSKTAFDAKGRRIDAWVSLTANARDLTLKQSYGWDDQDHHKVRPNYGFEFSDVFLDERLGILFGFSRSDQYSMQQHLWVGGGGSAYEVDGDPGNNATEVPRANSMQFQHGLRSSVRTNRNLRFDYRATPYVSASVKFDYNTSYNESLNRNYQMNVPANSATTGVVNSPGGPVVPGVEYSLRSQTIYGGTWQMTNSGTARAKFGDTMIVVADVEYRRDALGITAQGSFSRADNGYDSLGTGWFDNTVATTTRLNWSWNRSAPGSPHDMVFTQLTGADARNAANYTFDQNRITAVKRDSKDQIWSGRADLRYVVGSGRTRTTLKTGVSVTLNTRDVERQEGMQYMIVGADGAPNSGDEDLPQHWVETKFHSDWGWGGNANGLPVLDRFALARHYAANPSHFTVNSLQHLQTRLQNTWDFKERIDAGYVQSIFRAGRIEISPGVRVERTYSWGKGVHDIGDAAARRALDPVNPGAVSPASEAYLHTRYGGRLARGSRHEATLAYLHGTWRMRDNLLFRASYHDAITRADIANVIPEVRNVNESNRTLTISNPDLRPERSRNVNVGLEHYFEPLGMVSVSWFRSGIRDLQRTRTGIPVSDTWLASVYPGYTLALTENVANSAMSGFEIDYTQQLSFLPAPLQGIGVFANHTWLRFDTWDNYLNASRRTWNAGLSYTRGRFYGQFRANYTGRRQASTSISGWHYFDGERFMCDVSASYRLSARVAVFVNGRNIFDEPIWGYLGRKEAWTRYARFGGFWEIGLRGSL